MLAIFNNGKKMTTELDKYDVSQKDEPSRKPSLQREN